MRVKELRVGNWYGHTGTWSAENEKSEDGHVFKMELKHFGFICESRMDVEQIEPIHITEEILLKAGFEKIVGGFKNDFLLLAFITTHEYYECEVMPCGSDWLLIPIRYLHQLQNLILSLTGQELEINLTQEGQKL
jgi:hypothetical protein